MRKLSKKLLCLVSSAVLMCGASAMTASAGPLPLPDDVFGNVALDHGKEEYTLNDDYFEITRTEKARIEVMTPMVRFAGRALTSTSYQWYRNGNIINGATSSFYEASDEGCYYCKVTVKLNREVINNNSEGTAIKTETDNDKQYQEFVDAVMGSKKGGSFTVSSDTVNRDIVCEYKPSVKKETEPTVYTTEEAYVKRVSDLNVSVLSYSGPLNDNGKFELKASASGGSTPYSYQWKNSSGDVVGTSAVTTVTASGQYYCIVTDSRGRVKTSGVVNVRPIKVSIAKQPKDTVICSSKGAELSVGISGGTAPYTYTWYYGSTVVGRNSTVTVYDPGNYYCVVKDQYGDIATSQTAHVDINYFYIEKNLPSTHYTYYLNKTENFTVRVSGGTGRYRYLWQIADKGSNNWNELKKVTTYSTSNTCGIFLYSTEKKYRCIIYCVDDEDKSIYYRTTNEMEIRKVSKAGQSWSSSSISRH